MTNFIEAIPDPFLLLINVVSGASLGASFYILLKTQSYLVNRSFDPKYNAVYYTRFITGVISGVIMATALDKVLSDGLGKGMATLTPGVLAILGGYATEAVEQILQRLVDIILAAVRGDGSAEVKAKSAADQLEKNAEVRGKLVDIEAAAQKKDPARMEEVLRETHDLLKAGVS